MDNDDKNKPAGIQTVNPAELPDSAAAGAEKVSGQLDSWVLTPAQRTFIESLFEDDNRTDD